MRKVAETEAEALEGNPEGVRVRIRAIEEHHSARGGTPGSELP